MKLINMLIKYSMSPVEALDKTEPATDVPAPTVEKLGYRYSIERVENPPQMVSHSGDRPASTTNASCTPAPSF